MSSTVLRLLVAAWVLFLLGRAAIGAWHQRELALLVWRRITWRHVAAATGLFVLVASVAVGLLWFVPPLRYGLGAIVGFAGNAVFVPLEETASRPGAPPLGAGPDWVLLAVSTLFLGALALLLPWLAFVEEEVFRAGLEDASGRREVTTALVFGLAHLIMLVPLAAAVAVAVAGYVYGKVYRRAFERSDGSAIPDVVVRSFRPTTRSAAAAERARRRSRDDASVIVTDRTPERRQAQAVLASTVLHTTFNTLVVVLVWVSLTLGAFGL